MNKEFNEEFMKLSEKDQKSILNLIQFKNMNKENEYKKRISLALHELDEFRDKYHLWDHKELDEIENTLRGEK